MSIEETELTFIRCPSCGVLIPSVASRCRMCGHTLQEEKEPSDFTSKAEIKNDTTSISSRVRQKTISVSNEDIQKIKKQVVQKDEEKSEKLSSNPEDTFLFDENAVYNSKDTGLNWSGEGQNGESIIDRIIDNVDEQENADKDELQDMSAEAEMLEDRLGMEPGNLSESKKVDEENIPPSSPTSETRKRKRRRRKRKSPSSEASNFALSESLKSLEVEEKSEKQELSNPPVKNITQDKDVADEKREFQREMPKAEEISEPITEEKKEMEQAGSVDGMELNSAPVKKVKQSPSKNSDKPLVGWLVSFEMAEGKAIEIREGRFFVGSERIKPDDLIIPKAGLSTPHCLIKATAEGGIKVQDVMSEEGTFVRRAAESEYVSALEAVTLSHGDWLKLGGYEVMVCVIPPRNNEE